LSQFRKKFNDELIKSQHNEDDEIDEFEILNVKMVEVNSGEITFPENNPQKHKLL
jgi:hypothetical protein